MLFCCINAPFGTNRYRMRQPEKVVEEVDFLYHNRGVRTFKIIDEMFVLNDRHVSPPGAPAIAAVRGNPLVGAGH